MRRRKRPDGITRRDVVLYLVDAGPGRTQQQLADAIYGPGAIPRHIARECLSLAQSGEVVRRGGGVGGDPFTYYLSDTS